MKPLYKIFGNVSLKRCQSQNYIVSTVVYQIAFNLEALVQLKITLTAILFLHEQV